MNEEKPISKEKQIQKLKADLKILRDQGSFKTIYKKLRSESSALKKLRNLKGKEKKEELKLLCLEIIKLLEEK